VEMEDKAKNLVFGDYWGKLKSNFQVENQGEKGTFHFILRPARGCSFLPSYKRGQGEKQSLPKNTKKQNLIKAENLSATLSIKI